MRTPLLSGLTVTGLVAILSACGSPEVNMTCELPDNHAQLAERPSPFDSVSVVVDSAGAKVCYSRPFARDRLVFGGIVPWDTLWRTGANEPTIIRLSQAAEIAGLAVEPGKYSLYTVPSEDQWVLVVNASTSQWGQTRDQPMADGGTSNNAYTAAVQAEEVGRASISTVEIEFTEQFEAVFGAPTGQSVDLFFDWENTRLVVPIRFVGDS